MGARPMSRLMQDKVKRPLADELLFGKLVGGGRVAIDVSDGELVVEARPEPEKLLPATVVGAASAAIRASADNEKRRPMAAFFIATCG